MHLEVWDKDVDAPDDYIGSLVIALGQKSGVGFAACHEPVDPKCTHHPQLINMPTRMVSGTHSISSRTESTKRNRWIRTQNH